MSKEYIEREAAINAIKRYGTSNGSSLGYHSGAVDCAISTIEAFPVADVVEVRHGSWNKTHNRRLCSICNFAYYSNGDCFNYCPECGAKMDGKDGA